MKPTSPESLPVISCSGCGVCCLHMGYPAYILPSHPLTEHEINSDSNLRKLAEDPRTKKILLDGQPGENYWHELPADLKSELQEYMKQYVPPANGELDGPCIWFDIETRMCRNHEHRPIVCRDFETGSKKCLEWRRYYIDSGRIKLLS